MAYTNKHLRELVEILSKFPDGMYWNNSHLDKKYLDFQVGTMKEFKEIRSFFPGAIWKKKFEPETKWWEFDTVWEGWQIHVYACREAPLSCTAVWETKMVKEQVPVKFEERMVEKKTIVDWDCPKVSSTQG